MFPVGIMFYFGTNLDNRFAVPDFWPKEGESHKIPHDRAEIDAELARLRAKRLYLRDKRLAEEAQLRQLHQQTSQSQQDS
jgi:protein PET100, fungi type